MILRLENATDAPVSLVGGKFFGLARLHALNLPVPPAVVVPTSDKGKLENPEAIVRMLGEPLAVRSSAAEEDAADRSAAGQFESIMGVRAFNLVQAVQRVYGSAQSERVRAYTGKSEIGMAVVIQKEARSTRAGVAFSRDPLTGADEVLIECIFGHGELLVSGNANPDRYWVQTDGSLRARLAPKEGSRRLLRTLRDDEARAIAELVKRATRGFGHEVDVEFCYEGPQLWLVQCRAITTLGRA